MSVVFNSNSVRLGNADYSELKNKPAIGGVELTADTTLADLGLDKVFVYKGQVETYADLPKTDNKVGDAWNVADTGKNFAWNGEEWDDLDAKIWAEKKDLDQEIADRKEADEKLQSDIDQEVKDRKDANDALQEAIDAEKERAETEETTLSDRIDVNVTAIADNKTAIESEVVRATDAEEALGGRIDTNATAIAENKSAIEVNATNIAANTVVIETNTAAIEDNKTAIESEVTRATEAEEALTEEVNKKLAEVTHDTTLEGAGTEEDPLKVADIYVKTAQGTDNSGKILVVNTEGNLELANHTLDTSEFVTNESLETTLEDYATKEELEGKANTTDFNGKMAFKSVEDYYTKQEVSGLYVTKDQGVANAGKFLKVDAEGNVIASAESASGGIAAVVHDETLTGAGTEESPLSVVGGSVDLSDVAKLAEENTFTERNTFNKNLIVDVEDPATSDESGIVLSNNNSIINGNRILLKNEISDDNEQTTYLGGDQLRLETKSTTLNITKRDQDGNLINSVNIDDKNLVEEASKSFVKIDQGIDNAGKVLKIDTDGNVTVAADEKGLAKVAHDDTLTGKGTEDEPLSVVSPRIILRTW